MKNREALYLCIVLVMAWGVACTPPPSSSQPVNTSTNQPTEPTVSSVPARTPAPTTIIPVTAHLMTPAEVVPAPFAMIDDVESSGTGPEGRAPYGDSYKLNRFERPFLKDMTYVPGIDIHKFGLSEDEDWYYVFIRLIGNDINNAIGINYGAEIDLNADGFGDYIVWTHPPYTLQWSTDTVQVFQDSNQDTGGLSALRSDAVSDGDGYDTLVFDGSAQESTDPDLAWVRMTEDPGSILQIAFKKSLTGSAFLLGVLADAGLKDIAKLDYADHFTEADAGSPVKNNKYYPLGALYGVDNTCWQGYGIKTTGYEPKLCQPILQPINTGAPDEACSPPPDCNGDEPGTGDYDPDTCSCPQ